MQDVRSIIDTLQHSDFLLQQITKHWGRKGKFCKQSGEQTNNRFKVFLFRGPHTCRVFMLCPRDYKHPITAV